MRRRKVMHLLKRRRRMHQLKKRSKRPPPPLPAAATPKKLKKSPHQLKLNPKRRLQLKINKRLLPAAAPPLRPRKQSQQLKKIINPARRTRIKNNRTTKQQLKATELHKQLKKIEKITDNYWVEVIASPHPFKY
jgi:hypothetical protein